MARIYIGIGSNLGDRRANCLKAIEHLKERDIHIIRQSSMIETEPWGVRDQPKFINMVVEAETDLSPQDLIRQLKHCEQAMGRVQSHRWGPRLIDLDILFYEDVVIETEELNIPHPEIQNREFVLRSMCELSPDMKHPVLGKSMRELFEMLKKDKTYTS